MTSFSLLSLGSYSQKIHGRRFPHGEFNNSQKLQSFMKEKYEAQCYDILELLEWDSWKKEEKKIWKRVLQDMEISLRNDIPLAPLDIQEMPWLPCLEKKLPKKTILLLLSWHTQLLECLSLGLHKNYPFIAKIYSHYEHELRESSFPLVQLYEEAHMLICESLLAAKNALEAGIPAEKIIYLPHVLSFQAPFKKESEREEFKKQYLNKLAKQSRKNLAHNAFILAYPCRFLRRKNLDLAIELAYALHKDFPQLIFLVKGDFDREGDGQSFYTEKLKLLFQSLEKEQWFVWDQEYSSYSHMLQEYACYDHCLYLSGAEGANNSIAEMLALGIPCSILNSSSNPYLFQNLAHFLPPQGEVHGTWKFQQVHLEKAYELLKKRILEKKPQEIQKQKDMCLQRFSPHKIQEKIKILYEISPQIFHRTLRKEERNKVKEHLKQDFLDYGLEIPQELK